MNTDLLTPLTSILGNLFFKIFERIVDSRLDESKWPVKKNEIPRYFDDLGKKYEEITRNEQRWEEYNINEDNEILVVAFGTASRICKSALDDLNAEGHNVGLIRPITVWPYPYGAIAKSIGPKVKKVIVFELNLGQMIQDVKIAVNGKVPVEFMGKVGGIIFTPEEVQEKIRENL